MQNAFRRAIADSHHNLRGARCHSKPHKTNSCELMSNQTKNNEVNEQIDIEKLLKTPYKGTKLMVNQTNKEQANWNKPKETKKPVETLDVMKWFEDTKSLIKNVSFDRIYYPDVLRKAKSNFTNPKKPVDESKEKIRSMRESLEKSIAALNSNSIKQPRESIVSIVKSLIDFEKTAAYKNKAINRYGIYKEVFRDIDTKQLLIESKKIFKQLSKQLKENANIKKDKFIEYVSCQYETVKPQTEKVLKHVNIKKDRFIEYVNAQYETLKPQKEKTLKDLNIQKDLIVKFFNTQYQTVKPQTDKVLNDINVKKDSIIKDVSVRYEKNLKPHIEKTTKTVNANKDKLIGFASNKYELVKPRLAKSLERLNTVKNQFNNSPLVVKMKRSFSQPNLTKKYFEEKKMDEYVCSMQLNSALKSVELSKKIKKTMEANRKRSCESKARKDFWKTTVIKSSRTMDLRRNSSRERFLRDHTSLPCKTMIDRHLTFQRLNAKPVAMSQVQLKKDKRSIEEIFGKYYSEHFRLRNTAFFDIEQMLFSLRAQSQTT